jgi:beta-lactamase class A
MGSDNYFTANDAVTFLDRLDGGKLLASKERATLLDWMKDSPRSGPNGGWLGTRLPAAARAGMMHKAGWLPPGCCSSTERYNTLNEIGIVPTPDGGKYAVAILAEGGRSYWNRQAPFVEYASCVIYRAVIKKKAMSCAKPQ